MATRAGIGRVHGIDSLRGLAAVAVFWCHVAQFWPGMDLPGKLPELFALGAHGVDVFIVVSGFCLALPFTARSAGVDVGAFYGRRAWRMLPPYYAALLVAVLLATLPATWPRVVAGPAGPGDVVAHVLGVQSWFPSTLGTINGSLWTVSLEIQLYLVFPLVVLAWHRWGVRLLLLASVLLALAWFACGLLVPSVDAVGNGYALPARLVQFVAGIACAVLVRSGRRLPARAAFPLLAVLVLVGAVVDTARAPVVLSVLAWGAVGAVAVLALVGRTGERLARTPAEPFGRRSFSFYLLHQPLILLAAGPVLALLPDQWLVQLVVGGGLCLVATTLVAFALYRWVELPAQEAGKRRFPHVVRTRPAAPDPLLAPR